MTKAKATVWLWIDMTQEQIQAAKKSAKKKHELVQNYLASRIDASLVGGLHVDGLFIEKPSHRMLA